MSTTNAAWLQDDTGALAENDALTRLNRLASEMGVDIVDVAGFLDQTDQNAHQQLQALEQVAQQTRDLVGLKEQMLGAIDDLAASSDQARQDVSASVAAVQASSAASQSVSQWVQHVAKQLSDVQRILTTVASSNTQIADIAQQINMLAINAKIEAARAGEAGRGFSVVADAVNELSQRTAQVAEGITTSVDTLSDEVGKLHGEAGEASETASQVITRSGAADKALSGIETRMSETADAARQASDTAQSMGDAVAALDPAFQGLSGTLRETTDGVRRVRDRVNGLIDHSEGLIQASVELGGASKDALFIDLVRENAARIATLFEEAVASGRITANALFDTTYKPIPGSDPQQVLAPFTQLTDTLLPDIQEPVLEHSNRIVFCAAVDRNGYLPTHNTKFSAPQGRDPIWNAANCRNRRIFDDRVGLKAGANTAPFLLQTYRRDMGGGNFVLMKDVSSPIVVNGKHWGGLRLAFKPR